MVCEVGLQKHFGMSYAGSSNNMAWWLKIEKWEKNECFSVHQQKNHRNMYVWYHKKSQLSNMRQKKGGAGAIGQGKAWVFHPTQPTQAKFTNGEE